MAALILLLSDAFADVITVAVSEARTVACANDKSLAAGVGAGEGANVTGANGAGVVRNNEGAARLVVIASEAARATLVCALRF